jgi:SH3 domain-containing protein
MAQAPTVGKSPVNKNRLAKPPVAEPPESSALETVRPRMGLLTAAMVVCFSLGVAWPLLGGLDFVQRPPGSAAKAAEAEVIASEADSSASALATLGETPALHVAPMLTTSEAVRIESQVVESCQGDTGEAVARCDEPNLEAVIEAPIAQLAACDAAEGVSGVLSLGMYLDFTRGRVTRLKAGASTTLPKLKKAALMACAEEKVAGTALDDVEHEHGRYWMYYLVRFLPPGSPIDPASAPPPPEVVGASGQATIGWTTAVVRDSPSPRAKVAARLTYGTRVSVTGRAGDWYRIERAGKSLGWLHRKAIGM